RRLQGRSAELPGEARPEVPGALADRRSPSAVARATTGGHASRTAPRGSHPPRGGWSLVPVAIAVAESATAATRPTTARTAGTTGTAALVRFADAELAAAKVLTIERIARRLGGVCFHLDEAKAARSTRLAIRDHVGRLDPAVLLEERAQIRI